MSGFKFEFSLQVLNHLGRGLYRNFATVVAEAISNSWDAEATKVHIIINKEEKNMIISDNGKGMNHDDFQNRFLKVGYSRREDSNNCSKRKVLGRKGIGKLAMLSISSKIVIASKKDGEKEIGGIIDNEELDVRIKEDEKYSLQGIENKTYLKSENSGTYLEFISIKDTVNNPELMRKYLAVLFNFSFSFSNETFDIYVNSKKVTINDLETLIINTQFLWVIGLKNNRPLLSGRYPRIIESANILDVYSFNDEEQEYTIEGYVATVLKPSDIKIHGTGGDFRAGLHLFVNGRLRQENIFNDIPAQRIVENYVYGEIHVDGFDDGDDIFTSNREGVIKDSHLYTAFLKELKKIQSRVINDWDGLRIKENKKNSDKNIDWKDMKPEKKKAIKKFLDNKEDDDWKNKFSTEFMPSLLPKKSSKKILLCHAKVNKKYADVIYGLLKLYGFNEEEILYTSSDNMNSRLPVNTDLYDYLRRFFIQDWYYNPHVIFVTSKEMEESWYASIEAGATWVTSTNHNIISIKGDGYAPKIPLKISEIFIEFDAENNCEMVPLRQIFEKLAEKYEKELVITEEQIRNLIASILPPKL